MVLWYLSVGWSLIYFIWGFSVSAYSTIVLSYSFGLLPLLFLICFRVQERRYCWHWIQQFKSGERWRLHLSPPIGSVDNPFFLQSSVVGPCLLVSIYTCCLNTFSSIDLLVCIWEKHLGSFLWPRWYCRKARLILNWEFVLNFSRFSYTSIKDLFSWIGNLVFLIVSFSVFTLVQFGRSCIWITNLFLNVVFEN